jgi:hypothetical protein
MRSSVRCGVLLRTGSRFIPYDVPLKGGASAVETLAHPAAERLRVVELAVHEVAREMTPMPPPAQATDAIWANETDADFEAFQRVMRELRAGDASVVSRG